MTKFDTVEVGLGVPDLHSGIRIAIANIAIQNSDIISSYRETPNTSSIRLKKLSGLLNSLTDYEDKIDLVVFPELSIPHRWESMLSAWARKHNIGVICGLEHKINIRNEALNNVMAALPYKTGSGKNICTLIKRLKSHYSPEESRALLGERLNVPRARERYHLIRWRGVSFAIYNCYELTSIEDRSLFKGKVDFIVATVFNKDTTYFSNIVESAARDLHCYFVQVNDSNYGDSRIVSPSKTEIMNPLRIKGGDNLTFLTIKLDLDSLRDFQRKTHDLQKDDDKFKLTPPGLNPDDVTYRINLGR